MPVFRALSTTLLALTAFVTADSVRNVASAQGVEVYVSSKAGDRLSAKQPLTFAKAASTPATFRIDDGKVQQKMIGFGAALQEAGLMNLNTLAPEQKEAVLKAMFDPQSGAGFSAMTTYVGATDFMSAGPRYTYHDAPGDIRLEKFSIERDLGPNGLVTFIKSARKYGDFALFARMDYPPDWLLVNTNVPEDQRIEPKNYPILAQYYVRYLKEYAKQGIDVAYMAPFSEPGQGMRGYTKISFAEIGNVIRDHIGPAFEKEGIKTRITLGESISRGEAGSHYLEVLADPNIRKYLAGMSYHGYDFIFGQPISVNGGTRPTRREVAPTAANGYDFAEFKNISELHRQYPDLALWMSEVCYFRATQWIPVPNLDFDDGDFWGQQIFADINAGASAWTYWNAILDQKGGPWLNGAAHGYPESNAQHGVVIIDTEKKQPVYTGLYYYLAHFSKFVRPGSERVTTSGTHAGVQLLAFKRPDGKLVSQVINSQQKDDTVQVEWRGRVLELKLPARSISTYVWDQAKT